MQRLWSADELGEHWTLGPEELKLLAELTGAGKLGLAAQLAYWRQHGHFPNEEAELAPAVVGHLAAQVGAEADALDGYAGRDAPDAGTAAHSSITLRPLPSTTPPRPGFAAGWRTSCCRASRCRRRWTRRSAARSPAHGGAGPRAAR